MRERIYSTITDLTIKNLKLGNYDSLIDCSQIIDFSKKYGISAQLWDQDTFHPRFLRVAPKLSIVYGMGDRSLLDHPTLGIVGPRNPSHYGMDVTKDLVKGCAGSNIVTISGGADGIDECVHLQSLQENIPTIVVLGGGLGRFLQSSNRSSFLNRVVSGGGLILSEYKIFTRPEKYTFPQRNRIIAGLSDHLFIPEAGLKSGSLITAYDAVKVGTPVWTVPHGIYSATSDGTNNLIKSGFANYVYSFAERLSDLYIHKSKADIVFSVCLTDSQKAIMYQLNQGGPATLYRIQKELNMDLQFLMGDLAILEMEGFLNVDVLGNISVNY